MADNGFTLIDIMTGMEALSLNTILTPSCFKFFWGLVMLANRIKPRFRKQFDVTVEQAIGIGGGKSRSSVNQHQHALNNVMIDGQRLIWIKPGSREKNTAAKYKINWNLILSASPTVGQSTDHPSKYLDENQTKTERIYIKSVDENLSILRSEEKREEKKPPAQTEFSRVVEDVLDRAKKGGGFLSKKDEEKEKARDRSKQVEYIQESILAAFAPQITKKPPYNACRSAVDKFGFDVMEAAAIEAKGKTLDDLTSRSALNYVVSIARNGQSGLSYEQRMKIAGKLKELKTDLLHAQDEDDLSKFEGVFVAGQVVQTKDEFCGVVQSEIERLEKVSGK